MGPEGYNFHLQPVATIWNRRLWLPEGLFQDTEPLPRENIEDVIERYIDDWRDRG